jgi:hypothetical protein
MPSLTDTTFNPGSVMMGGSGAQPYMPTGQVPKLGSKSPADPAYGNVTIGPIQPQPNVLGAETVRATGSGPFDSAYRQNLATYGGGNFMRPGGNLSFNPTDASTFPGNPTGGGNAPLPGLPDSLVGRALSGNPFSYTPPSPNTPSGTVPPGTGNADILGFQDWLKRFLGQGSGFAMGAQ